MELKSILGTATIQQIENISLDKILNTLLLFVINLNGYGQITDKTIQIITFFLWHFS